MQQTNLTNKRNKQTKAWVHRQMQGDTKLIILGNLGAHFISQNTNTSTKKYKYKYKYKYKCKYKYKYRYKYTYKCCKQCGQVQKVQLLNLQCYNCKFKRPKDKISIVSHRRRKNTYYLDRKQLHVVWDSIYLRVFLFCFFYTNFPHYGSLRLNKTD